MTNIQVYDPALCCSTGVCGVDVDQGLVSFSADVDWVRQNGANVERFNLAQQPMAFAENTLAKALFEKSGQEGLPLILVNGQQVLAGRYPSRDELAAWAGLSVAGESLAGENEEHTLITPNASGDAGTSPASAAPKACCGPANEPAKSAEPVKGKCC